MRSYASITAIVYVALGALVLFLPKTISLSQLDFIALLSPQILLLWGGSFLLSALLLALTVWVFPRAHVLRMLALYLMILVASAWAGIATYAFFRYHIEPSRVIVWWYIVALHIRIIRVGIEQDKIHESLKSLQQLVSGFTSDS